MSDIFTKEKRSEIMSRVRGGNTGPELTVRKVLHGMGFRFRLHDKKLPGNPDIVLPRHKAVILVHGCFWHGHENCKRARLPTSNVKFWQAKIASNVERDGRNVGALAALGWRVLIIWSCQIGNVQTLKQMLRKFLGVDADNEKLA